MRLFFLIIALLAAHVSFADPTTKLLLVGGGNRPPEAMKLLSAWAGGESANVLIVGWASEVPEQYFGTISADLGAAGITHFSSSLKPILTQAERDAFVETLNQATAIFFTGGDQNKAMKVVDQWNLKPILSVKFQAGIPFAGTSAGTALMSDTMITGNTQLVDGVETQVLGKGLGFMQKAIVDMHFIVRNREPRLIQSMKEATMEYGIGVDEDGALAVVNSTDATVVGDKHVVFFDQAVGQSLIRTELGNQATFDIKNWQTGGPTPPITSKAR
jgi:cyanophycinase